MNCSFLRSPPTNGPGKPGEDREGLEQAWEGLEQDQTGLDKTKQDQIRREPKKRKQRTSQVNSKSEVLNLARVIRSKVIKSTVKGVGPDASCDRFEIARKPPKPKYRKRDNFH